MSLPTDILSQIGSTPNEYWANAHNIRASQLSQVDVGDGDGVAGARTINASDALCRWMDFEVAAVAAFLVDLKARRNSFRSPAALPVELLAYIFKHLKAVFPMDLNSSELGWIMVTHVCRTWRNAALEYPSLWSTIDLGSYDQSLIWAMLKRSKQAPLYITARKYRARVHFRLSDEQCQRVQSLDIEGYSDDDVTGLINRLPDSLPTLRSIRLVATSQSYLDGLRSSLIADHSRSLTQVSLESICFPWSATFSHIRTLSLYGPRESDTSIAFTDGDIPDPSYSFTDILRCLGNMGTLEILSLKGVIPPPAVQDELFTSQPPNLRQLSLLGADNACSAMLRFLIIPPRASVSVICAQDKVYTKTLSEIAKRIASPATPRFRHLQVRGSRFLMVHFTIDKRTRRVSTLDGSNSINPESPELFLCFAVWDDSGQSEIFQNVVTSASCLPIESFGIFDFYFWDVNNFSAIFNNLTSLRHLQYISFDNSIKNLFSALSSATASPTVASVATQARTSNAKTLPCVPELETISFDLHLFDELDTVGYVRKVLEERKKVGVGLQKIELLLGKDQVQEVDNNTIITLLEAAVPEIVFSNYEDLLGGDEKLEEFTEVYWGV